MIKELFSSIFRSNISQTKTENQSNTALFPDIPFFGKKGTICRVEDDKLEDTYKVVVYNHDGTINPIKITTPKRKGKNLSAVTEEYYNDLKKYLDFTNTEYMNCKNNRLHKQINKKQLKIAGIISITMTILSFPALISSIQVISYIGAIVEASSLLFLYITYDLKKKVQNDEKKKTFIEQYNRYQEKLVMYNQKQSQNTKLKHTQYTEIPNKTTSISLENTKSKTKILVKEESKAA